MRENRRGAREKKAMGLNVLHVITHCAEKRVARNVVIYIPREYLFKTVHVLAGVLRGPYYIQIYTDGPGINEHKSAPPRGVEKIN